MSPKSAAKSKVIGKPLDRVDGRLKVTGAAHYAAEYRLDKMCYGVVIQSSIPCGRVKAVDSSAAQSIPGVLAVYSYANKPMTLPKNAKKEQADRLSLLQDATINYAGQIIAMVVAETFEIARHAASMVKVSYDEKPFVTEFARELRAAVPPKDAEDNQFGNVRKGIADAHTKIEASYSTPKESHNPMEPFAAIACWNGDSLTLYDSTQGVFPSRNTVAEIFGMPADKVRVICKFVGGGFGCKLLVWSHVVIGAMAARQLQRPVKVVLARTQMYGPVGFRPATEQRIVLAAAKDGKLLAIRHNGINETSRFKEFVEAVSDSSGTIYACANVETSQKLVKLDIGQPVWMRAPGHATGSFALESAMDELAYALNIDPVDLRIKNYADKDYRSGLPWSSKSLIDCYRQGAERFGWRKRNARPMSMRDGRYLVGWGMAGAMHSVWRNPASARVELRSDGTALVQAGSQDIGTGTYTVMSQVAAEKLSLPFERVHCELGDTDLPPGPTSGGSTTAGSVGNAVAQACSGLMEKLIQLAVENKESPLFGSAIDKVVADDGKLALKNQPETSETYQAILARVKGGTLENKVATKLGNEEKEFAMAAFGAIFAEVKVDPDLCTVHASRFTGVYSAGHILNPKTARSQILGGITFGLGMALMEHTIIDHRYGKIINADLAEYHVPVHPDIGEIDVSFIEETDPHVNAIGVKGLGEVGITGVAAAIANAVYHATGKRVRDLPITLDKLL